MSLSQADILRALELVKLPASGQSIAASGRVTDVLIDNGKVIFAIAIDATEASAMEPVRKAAESAVGGLPGVTQVLVGLTAAGLVLLVQSPSTGVVVALVGAVLLVLGAPVTARRGRRRPRPPGAAARRRPASP